ncbi:hypothetical protein CSR02_13130 [Acetobacter pomorum]|uniref:Transposase DDE domain-containing protein n=1 Tax=Acetobacter pomorum TaxID=65959 RepID=A0A2G4R9A7_9PROT|nr:hypothetical protein CSR02_13130 [Acetobacter pomorum]
MERERIAIQRETTPNLLKTQTGRHRKNRQSNRQNPEITGQAHQSRVLRSLQIVSVHEKPYFSIYKKRNIIEQFFASPKQFKGTATLYDKLESTFITAVQLVSVIIGDN